MRSPLRMLTAAVVVLGLLVGCQSTPGPVADIPRAQAPMQYSRDMPVIAAPDWAARGEVLSSSQQTAFDTDALPTGSAANTFVYQSISGITGASTVVGGALFTPPGAAPAGGWRVVGYAHYTTGATPDCGTLGDPRLSGVLPGVAALLEQGYAVAYTDYAGLGPAAAFDGADEVHPYLEPKSEAFNLIDAVRAARTLEPRLSNQWVAYGASQGGQAAWAAAEYAPVYAEGTELLGAVALAPAADLSRLGELTDGTFTTDQEFIYPTLITGLAAVDPGINPDDYFSGELRRGLGAVVACRGPNAEEKDAVLDAVDRSQIKTPTPEATGRLVGRLQSYSLPQRPTPTPLLVTYGSEDALVLPQWTAQAVERACGLGDNIMAIELPGQGHALDAGQRDYAWIADRFAGVPAVGNC
ncbi:lipase family protein [Mycolicibacterium mengxianglii]|uniref:lipase family protein n=1 Tax=Mycolicibacterium mengxianglii TaxID=2736649 RepID=UPI0018EEED5F|nr:lipase family protein [Mycolicibacterium mengxianglii]